MQGMGIDLAVGSLGVGMRGHGMVFLQGRDRSGDLRHVEHATIQIEAEGDAEHSFL
jgi:hypothetical protein